MQLICHNDNSCRILPPFFISSKIMEKKNDLKTEGESWTPSKANRHVIQSYIFSSARSRFNIIQMRILYRLVEFAQCEIEGILIKNNMCKMEHNLRHVDISLPISSVLPDGAKHYERARDSLKAMQDEKIELYDSETRTWRCAPVVYNITLADRKGVLEFSVADFVWDSLLDFTHGYRQLELLTVLSLHSPNSMKMYALIAGLKNPMFFSFERIREIFGVQGKYVESYDIIKRILKPCKEELDKSCPFGYEFKPVREGRKFTGVTIFPYAIDENTDKNLQRKQLMAKVPSSLLYGEIYRYLRYNLYFDAKEINANKELLKDCSEHMPNVIDFLSRLQARYRNVDGSFKSKGWIIGALKSELHLVTHRGSSKS